MAAPLPSPAGPSQGDPSGDITKIANSFPELPTKQVIRENVLSTLDDMFASGIQLLTVEGAEEIGKTTLLAQFAIRHATHAISLFIRPTSWFSYDLQILLRDICNQMFFVLRGRELAEDEQTDESYYRQLVFGLSRLAGRANRDFYFVIDGLEDVPDEVHVKSAIIGMLPVGVARVKCLVAARPEFVLEFLGRKINHKTYVLSGFALEETFGYFSDLHIERKFFEELYKISSRGIPGQIASIRRLVEAGTPPEALLNDLPKKLPNVFDLEWKAVDQTNEKLLNVLALVSQPSPKHSVADIALIVRDSDDVVRELLRPLAFVKLPRTDHETAEFVSERFRRYAEDRLLPRREIVRALAIDFFLQYPESDNAFALLPTYLEQAGKLKELVAYLSPEHLNAMVRRSGSLLPVRQNTALGVSTAFRLGHDADLLRFGVQNAILKDLNRFSTLTSEVRARMSLGQYTEAISVAQAAVLKHERLSRLAAIARFQKEDGLTPKPELLEQIGILFEDVSPDELGETAVQLASDLMYSRPDLGIKLAERLPDLDTEDRETDWNFAHLSIDAQVNLSKDKAGMEAASQTFRNRIKDPLARQFSSAVSIMLGDYSANDILAETQKLSTPSEKIFMLRLWARHTDDKENSADAVESALRLAINSSEYSPTAKDFRELATPLPKIADRARLQKLIAIFDGQRGILKTAGPTQDYIRLQLILAEAEAKTSTEAASARLQETYLEVRAIKDLETRTACTVSLMAAMPLIDPQNKLQDTPIIGMLVEEEFQEESRKLLDSAADHEKITRGMIEALSVSLPEKALALAKSLNVEPRRDDAIMNLIEAASSQPLDSIPFRLLKDVLGSIADADSVDQAVERLLRRIHRSEPSSIEAKLDSIIPLVEKSCTLQDIVLRCKACGWSAAILARVAQTQYAGLKDKVFQTLKSTWKSMDEGIDKINSAYRLAGILAKDAREEALAYLHDADELKRDPQLNCGREVYISSLRLAIRAFSGLFARHLETPDDLAAVAAAIDRIPSLLARVRLWTEVSLRYFRAERGDDGRRIASQHLQPLLDSLSKQDFSLWKRAITISSPALYQAHAASTLELVSRLPIEWRDVSLDLITEFIFHRVPPNDPFENKEDQCNLNWPAAADISNILQLMDSDGLIYGHIATLVQSAIWNHNETPLTREQKNDLARLLTEIVSKKLPNARFITHNGFAVIASAQIAKLQKHSTADWDTIVASARSVPNVSDRLFVLAMLAEILPADLWPQKIALLKEAHQMVQAIPSMFDKLSRLQTLASLAVDLDKVLAKKIVEEAKDALLRTPDPESDPIQRRLVDLAYRIDPDAASSLASSLDTDQARQRARERIKYNDLRESLTNKQHESLDQAGASSERLADVSEALLGQLNANRIAPRQVRLLRDWLRVASSQPLKKSYPIFSFAIENAASRVSKSADGRLLLRELFDASLASCALVSAIATRKSVTKGTTKMPTLQEQSSTIFIHEGERPRAIQYLRSWLETTANSFLLICDPYFGIKDLDVLKLVLETNAGIDVSILTSRRKQEEDGLADNFAAAYRQYWHKHFSDQEPPCTELAVVGTQITGELPIHDRWWLTRDAGISIGTSFNSLGLKGGAAISVLAAPELLDRQTETEAYLRRLKREHAGQKLTFSFGTI